MARLDRAVRRQRSPFAMAFSFLALALFLAVGLVAGLWAVGAVELPFLSHPQSRAGLVPVPMSNQPIAAFTKLTRDHVADPRTGGMNLQWLPEKQLSASIIRDPSKIVGRVLSHDKLPQYAFVEEDFLPVGTRPGLVGGTPPGKRSLTFDAENLTGVHGLRAGDHVDLIASSPIDSPAGAARNDARSKGLAAQAEMAKMRKRASVHVLAQDALVVMPVTTRNKPVTVGSLTQGKQTRMVPVQEIVIAVDPQEVAPIGEAIAMKLGIACVIRSGRPEDPGASVATPGADPLDDLPVNVVDAIHGTKREALVFSGSDARLLPPLEGDGQSAATEPARSPLRTTAVHSSRPQTQATEAAAPAESHP